MCQHTVVAESAAARGREHDPLPDAQPPQAKDPENSSQGEVTKNDKKFGGMEVGGSKSIKDLYLTTTP